jgi:hypothetical protein
MKHVEETVPGLVNNRLVHTHPPDPTKVRIGPHDPVLFPKLKKRTVLSIQRRTPMPDGLIVKSYRPNESARYRVLH